MPYYTVTEEEIKANVLFEALKLNNKAIIQYTWEDRNFWRSTSGWGAAHLAALRVLVFPDLAVDRIIPAEFQVTQDPNIISDVKKFLGLTLDQVKAGRYDRLDPARTFYAELASLVRVVHVPASNLSPATSPHPDTIMSMSFSSSEGSSFHLSPSPARPTEIVEDTREIITNNLLVAFLSLLSDIAYRINDPTRLRPEFNSCPERLKFLLAGGAVTSENDGSGWKMRFSKSTNQWVRTGGAPIISLECKRNVHGLEDHELLGQETGELLAVAKLKSCYENASKSVASEAYMVSCHHTKMYISTVQVTPDYFESCDKGIIKSDQYFLIRRSRTWDLADVEERVEGALAFLGVLKYTMSS